MVIVAIVIGAFKSLVMCLARDSASSAFDIILHPPFDSLVSLCAVHEGNHAFPQLFDLDAVYERAIDSQTWCSPLRVIVVLLLRTRSPHHPIDLTSLPFSS